MSNDTKLKKLFDELETFVADAESFKQENRDKEDAEILRKRGEVKDACIAELEAENSQHEINFCLEHDDKCRAEAKIAELEIALRIKSEEHTCCSEDLIELAAQNEAMRDIAAKMHADNQEEVYFDCRTILNMPNIAAEILRKRDEIRDKKTIRDIANIIGAPTVAHAISRYLNLLL